MSAGGRVRYVDTHAHLDDPAFDADRVEVIAAARGAGVDRIVNVGYCPQRWETSLRLAADQPGISVMLGVHPQHADHFSRSTSDELSAVIARAGAVAVGEIGYDFHRGGPERSTQRRAFEAQIDVARGLGLPIVVHQRAAEEDVVATLSKYRDIPGVVLHSFEGSSRLARFALDRGYALGVGGLATRTGSAALRALLAQVPVDSIVLETDSPYLLPNGIKVRGNEPCHLAAVAERLVPLYTLSGPELVSVTSATAALTFRLDDRLPQDGGAAT